MSKFIIAGGRNYKFSSDSRHYLDSLPITEVVCGCCSGADEEGKQWALLNDIPITYFPADWAKYGRSAGPIRNREMAQYADAVVLFPGGKGTNSMFKEAKKAKILVYDMRAVDVRDLWYIIN